MSDVRALFIQCSCSGVAHYRLESWAKASHRVKIGNILLPWWDKSLNETHPWEVDIDDPRYRQRILNEMNDHVKKANVIVAQMCHTRSALDLLLSIKEAYGLPIVTEIDDNIMSVPTYNVANTVYQSGSILRQIAVEQFEMSDAMVVSTPYLKEVYSAYCSNIYVMPNSLDFRIWDNLKHRANTDFIRIGWAAGKTHDDDLAIIEPVVHKILAKYPNVRFSFVCGVPKFFRNIDRVEVVDASARIDRYPQFLASRSFDIGLAPLVDSAFNRGKSNLRWLEYAGLKVPCVASNVGHFAQTIKQAEDGFLCDGDDEWMAALSMLIEDADARRAMGKAANRRARHDFNIDVNVSHYVKALGEIVERGTVVKIGEDAPPVNAIPAEFQVHEPEMIQ